MLIHRALPNASLAAVTPAAKPSASEPPASPPSPAATVSVSAEARSLSAKADAVDVAKVEALRARLAAGKFSVDHRALARSMLAAQ